MNIFVNTAEITITIDDFIPIPLTEFGSVRYSMALKLLGGATGVTLQEHILTVKGASLSNPWLLNFTMAPQLVDEYVLIGAFFKEDPILFATTPSSGSGNVGTKTFPLIVLSRDQTPALVTYSQDLNIFTVPAATMGILDVGEASLTFQPLFSYAIVVQQKSSGKLGIIDPGIKNEPGN